MSEQTPEGAHQVTDAPTPGDLTVQEAPENAGPTTSPDVVVINEPGDGPGADAEQSDNGEQVTEEGDPESTDEAVDADSVLGDE